MAEKCRATGSRKTSHKLVMCQWTEECLAGKMNLLGIDDEDGPFKGPQLQRSSTSHIPHSSCVGV